VLAPEQQLRHWLREYAQTWPRYGYRRAWADARKEGWVVNRKRVQRLWREEGLRVPAAPPKRQRVGSSTVPAHRLRATRINQVWALDFLFDATSDGRPIKALAMCDEWSRESIGRELGRSITAEDVVRILDQAKAVRGAPEHVRMDNGPEFIAEAIRDWCRFSGTGSVYIEPGSPWQNPFVESFNGKARDELFAREVFQTVLEARVLYFDWCDVYNRRRPHSSLGYLTPEAFARMIKTGDLDPLVPLS
jgi:putative transposase